MLDLEAPDDTVPTTQEDTIMNRTSLALFPVVALTLAGCGSSNAETVTDDETTDESSVLQDRIETLEDHVDDLQEQVSDQDSTITELVEDAETAGDEPEENEDNEPDTGGQTDEPDHDVSPVEDEDPSEDEPSSAEDEEGDEDSDATTEYGESAVISGWGAGLDYEDAGTIALNSVDVGFSSPACDDLAYAPQNGHFLALDLTVEANTEAYEDVRVTEHDFYIVDDEGTIHREEAQSFEAYGCASQVGMLEEVPAGTNHTGYIMLDTHLTEGTLVYQGLDEDVAWTF